MSLHHQRRVDYRAVADEIQKGLRVSSWENGTIAPVLVRLAWHASGTYDAGSKCGGSNGATMRFAPESNDPANAGLVYARLFLEPVKKKFPGISYADLWTLAGVVAIKELGGPEVSWHPGRADHTVGINAKVPPNGRLPDASKGENHVRDVFNRMGFNDRETVALVGCHCIGACHSDRSGFDGAWTYTPTKFSNAFFRELLRQKWQKKKWDGPEQFENGDKALMMLPSDMALVKDTEYRKYVELYAKDQNIFFNDFAKAFAKLIELGVKREQKPSVGSKL